MIFFLFAIGFFIIIKGADYLVEGSIAIAQKFNIPKLVIGLTIVSFGTSMPELVVNVVSSLKGSSEIAIGNVMGSNIANILLILGVSAIICPLPINKQTYYTEIPFSLTATLLVGFLANAALFNEGSDILLLSRQDGMALFFFFLLFMLYIYVISKEKREIHSDMEEYQDMSIGKALIFIVGGMLGLYFGGEWIVMGAIRLANAFDMSEKFIGLTVIAFGTSLPELVTSAVAAYKKNTDIAVGNVIGSNIFNMLWILGVSAMIKPLPFDVLSNSDIVMIIISSSLLLLAVAIGKRTEINRYEGAIFLIAYFSYIIFLLDRG